MASKRIVYQDWIVALGCDPRSQAGAVSFPSTERLLASIERLADRLVGAEPPESEDGSKERVIEAVHEALGRLGEQERNFVILYFFMGKSCRQIAEESGRADHKIEALHGRVIKQLRTLLADFVTREFGLKIDRTNSCPICNSRFRAEMELLIASKKETDTWRETIRLIKENYQLRIKTPQTLIGHQKFHH